ncbi:MAG: hypothetical protein ACFFA3_12590 [Promethearchaeota archaeon]
MQNTVGNMFKLANRSSKQILLFSVIVISFVLVNFNINPNNNANQDNSILDINAFNKENYTEILTTTRYGLGNITIDDIRYNFVVPGIVNQNVYHPLVSEDLISGKLSINTTKIEFIESTSPAIIDNLDKKIEDRNYAKYKYNETLKVKYDKTEARYLVYHSRFVNAELLEIRVDNGTIISELVEDVDYTIDNQGFIVFYYEDYFDEGRISNFSMYLTWENLLAFGNWKIEQLENQILEIDQIEQDLSVDFQYQFRLVARAYSSNLVDVIDINFWDVALTVNPFEMEQLTNHKLKLNGIEADIGNHLNPDKSIKIKLSDLFTPESSRFSLNFTTTFTLRFDNRLGKFWAIDRLVDLRSVRERIYLCHLISGPKHYYLKNVFFNESSIYFEEVLDSYSLFDRYVSVSELNINLTGYLGMKVHLPFMYVGETCPVLVKYLTSEKLKIVITDEIKMPLVGAKIEVSLFGAPYGTYISNITSQPIIPRRSDENGQIILNNVPRGNYTIRIYYERRFIKEAQVTTFKNPNYIYTNVPHSPLWIITFAIVTGSILIIGAILYLKYKTLRS